MLLFVKKRRYSYKANFDYQLPSANVPRCPGIRKIRNSGRPARSKAPYRAALQRSMCAARSCKFHWWCRLHDSPDFFASLCYNLSSMQTHRESKCAKTQLTRISHFLPFNVAKRCQRNSPDNGPRYLMTVSATFAESAHPTVEPPAPFGRRWNPDPSPGCCFWCWCW